MREGYLSPTSFKVRVVDVYNQDAVKSPLPHIVHKRLQLRAPLEKVQDLGIQTLYVSHGFRMCVQIHCYVGHDEGVARFRDVSLGAEP